MLHKKFKKIILIVGILFILLPLSMNNVFNSHFDWVFHSGWRDRVTTNSSNFHHFLNTRSMEEIKFRNCYHSFVQFSREFPQRPIDSRSIVAFASYCARTHTRVPHLFSIAKFHPKGFLTIPLEKVDSWLAKSYVLNLIPLNNILVLYYDRSSTTRGELTETKSIDFAVGLKIGSCYENDEVRQDIISNPAAR